jgi:hypothetical protein
LIHPACPGGGTDTTSLALSTSGRRKTTSDPADEIPRTRDPRITSARNFTVPGDAGARQLTRNEPVPRTDRFDTTDLHPARRRS